MNVTSVFYLMPVAIAHQFKIENLFTNLNSLKLHAAFLCNLNYFITPVGVHCYCAQRISTAKQQ